jgi:hypothetical protein
MSKKLSLNIFRLLHNRTKSTSIRRLERQGVKNVSILNVKDLKTLIQDAVDKTLKDLGISLSQEELQKINDRTREEFLRILNDRDELKASMRTMGEEMEILKENIRLMKAELDVDNRLLQNEESQILQNKLAQVSHDREANLDSTLLVHLKSLLAESNVDVAVKDEVLRLTLHLVEKERERSESDIKASQEDRVHKLKRRIAKLNAKLEETEKILEKVRSQENMDQGVASEFKTPQGMDSDAVFREEKKALLKEIFTLNMDLKKLITEA